MAYHRKITNTLLDLLVPDLSSVFSNVASKCLEVPRISPARTKLAALRSQNPTFGSSRVSNVCFLTFSSFYPPLGFQN
ncbi:hypothetical protein COLO4_07291 [Corchorus olitorius]|uniref:Uncharacterized protein n=1 Tax=Corchorus olitorius TaxID=93759 RepID=A0A1R3KK59_9ROSI|nr:hypothetical protein COLO4_07291 [Corchorus olitorius]